VLAGSEASAVGEALQWPTDLEKSPRLARPFYLIIAIATGGGVVLNIFHFDPIKALFWSAVIDDVPSAPIMVAMTAVALISTLR